MVQILTMMVINKYLIIGLICGILSCEDIKVIIQKKTLESNLNLTNKINIDASGIIFDSFCLNLVKKEFKTIVIDSVYRELIGTNKQWSGFQYSIDSGNFGVAKFIDSDSIKLINFYNQLDISTENLRPSFTLYFFEVDKKTVVVNTFTDSRGIYTSK